MTRVREAAGVIVKTCDPSREPRWDAFVHSRLHSSIYHTAAWSEVLHRAYGHRVAGLLCEDGSGVVMGVLPLIERRGVLTRRELTSLPGTPYAGILAASDTAAAALARAALERATASGAHLVVKEARDEPDQRPLPGLCRRPFDSTYVLRLPEDGRPLPFASARDRRVVRAGVRRAERSGLRVRSATSEADLRAWYQLYLLTMRKHVLPPKPRRFFEHVWRLLQPEGHLSLVLADDGAGRPLAGCLFLRHGTDLAYVYNGSDPRSLRLRPNDLIHLHVLDEARASGVRTYDMGEVDDGNEGLREYKLKWGAQPATLHRWTPASDDDGRRAHLASGSATAHLRQTAAPIWRRTPLGLTSGLGGWAHRWL